MDWPGVGTVTLMVTALGVGGFMALVLALNHRCFLALQRSAGGPDAPAG